MSSQNAIGQSDKLILPFLQATGEGEASKRLQNLIHEHVGEIVAGILRRKLATAGATNTPQGESPEQTERDDLHSDITLQLLTHLQEIRNGSRETGIANFRAYVAMTTYNAVNNHFRKKYPNRCSLENKLRYLLEHRAGLALWKSRQGEWIAGFAAWQERVPDASLSPTTRQLIENPAASLQRHFPREDPVRMDPGGLLAALFQVAGEPITLDDLVRIVAELWDVRDRVPEPLPAVDEPGQAEDTGDSLSAEVLGRLDLKRYWAEICQLPSRQCAALLLQARDPNGNCILDLLEIEGVASLREMARAMEIAPEKLAGLWNGLPMEDAQIAELLEVSTQHVARMRMIARRRIAERIFGAEIK